MIRNSAKKQSKKNKTGIETRTKIEINIEKKREKRSTGMWKKENVHGSD